MITKRVRDDLRLLLGQFGREERACRQSRVEHAHGEGDGSVGANESEWFALFRVDFVGARALVVVSSQRVRCADDKPVFVRVEHVVGRAGVVEAAQERVGLADKRERGQQRDLFRGDGGGRERYPAVLPFDPRADTHPDRFAHLLVEASHLLRTSAFQDLFQLLPRRHALNYA